VRVVVVGAGIIGLAAARAVLEQMPDAEVVVLDKESGPGFHQTSHNSGVVHAGVYYTAGSLKARLCRRGLLRNYCSAHGIGYEECGKVVVATTAGELDRLSEIARRAEANGVPGARLLDERELHEVEPHASGIAALRRGGTRTRAVASGRRRGVRRHRGGLVRRHATQTERQEPAVAGSSSAAGHHTRRTWRKVLLGFRAPEQYTGLFGAAAAARVSPAGMSVSR
jgi:glycine/D-amino acid oxidase-like deaminating enzyme